MITFASEKISTHITRILCPGNVYAYLVQGTQDALLIDTGFGIGSLKEYVGSLTESDYKVILTHGHLDHAGGAGEFEQVYLNTKDQDLAAEHISLEKRMPMCSAESGIHPSDLIPPADVKKFLPLINGQSFALGDLTVTAYPLAGHTPGSMCILFEEERTILLGDACNSYGFLWFPESANVGEYLRNLNAFRQYEALFDKTLYSHPHNFGGKEILDETRQLCEEIMSGVCKGIPLPMPGSVNCLLAKPVDAQNRRMDGGAANFVYRE